MQKYHDEPKQYKGYLKSALTVLSVPLLPKPQVEKRLTTG